MQWLNTSEGDWECDVTDVAEQETVKTLQGPLKPGQYRDVGEFSLLINKTLRQNLLPELNGKEQEKAGVLGISIYAICIYATEGLPVAACRYFKVVTEEKDKFIKPVSFDTKVLSKRKQRRRVTQWLERYL